ncbi:MAG: hypothetical protein Ct9H300mP10_07210 [Methanobacteriota archaeon]|nr:MAG: hypothetical protein Ct9H300mP10_07210 [Euryarchaeota archaeon]
MVAAGLLARNARDRGLSIKPWVKPSLAPGSRVVTEYYDAAGLTEDLDALGFSVVGYGCTTCIGNSGPLDEEIETAVDEANLVVGSVLSGNRNFEGRIHQKVKANYLASPPLVVAYALAGNLDIDFSNDPIGHTSSGEPVMLADIWPSDAEIRSTVDGVIDPEMFKRRYEDILSEPRWDAIPSEAGSLYGWDDSSPMSAFLPSSRGSSPNQLPSNPSTARGCWSRSAIP